MNKNRPTILNSAQFIPSVLNVGKSDLNKATALNTVLSTLDDIQEAEDTKVASFSELQNLIKDVGNKQTRLHKRYTLNASRNQNMDPNQEDIPNPDTEEEAKTLDAVFNDDLEKQENNKLALPSDDDTSEDEGATGTAEPIRDDKWAKYDWPPLVDNEHTDYYGSKIEGMYTGNIVVPEKLEPITLNHMMCLMTRCMTRLCNEFGTSFDGFYQDTRAHTYYYTVNIPEKSGSKESWATAKESLNDSITATCSKFLPMVSMVKEPKPAVIDPVIPKVTVIKKSSKKALVSIPKINTKKIEKPAKHVMSKSSGFFEPFAYLADEEPVVKIPLTEDELNDYELSDFLYNLLKDKKLVNKYCLSHKISDGYIA